MTPTVIVRMLEDGSLEFMQSAGVTLLVVDDNCPGDRVYQYGAVELNGQADVDAVIGEDAVGSSDDERHTALAAVVLEAVDGKPRLQVVK